MSSLAHTNGRVAPARAEPERADTPAQNDTDSSIDFDLVLLRDPTHWPILDCIIWPEPSSGGRGMWSMLRRGCRTLILIHRSSPSTRLQILTVTRHASTKSEGRRTESHDTRSSLARAVLPRPKAVLQFCVAVWLGMAGLHIIWHYFYEVTECEGVSMLPSLNSFGDWLVISKYYRRGRALQVGDVVSFKHPIEQETIAVKRVLALSGDFVCRDTPGVGSRLVQVPAGHCWVVGDNLTHSRDSRLFGPLPLALVRGKVVYRIATHPWWAWPEPVESTLRLAAVEDDVD